MAAGTGGTLLAVNKGRSDHSVDGQIEIGIGADEDGVSFPPISRIVRFDPDLIGFGVGGALVESPIQLSWSQ